MRKRKGNLSDGQLRMAEQVGRALLRLQRRMADWLNCRLWVMDLERQRWLLLGFSAGLTVYFLIMMARAILK
ncbi:hypothetical protein [Pedobacter jeongneungensis]|uniref:hypothetical protein n=1 Tax=Pedobacter jeongneungensis TaxID=947309 RepID=UPI00046A33C5|nr:hypothetical protein [Pedobacter jeongneungensis]